MRCLVADPKVVRPVREDLAVAVVVVRRICIPPGNMREWPM